MTDHIKDEMWRKVIVNCVINPINAMTRTEVGAIADERLDPLKRLIVEECVSVARHDGVQFDGDLVEAINRRYGPSKNRSSMQQDLLRGRRTEIDFLNGAVARLGASFGIACPVNLALTAIVTQLELQAGSTVAGVSDEHAADLELARRCAIGDEAAWDRFVLEFRPVLYRAADMLEPGGGARDLADALYADLYGVNERDGERRSLFKLLRDAAASQRGCARLRSKRPSVARRPR